MANLRWQLQQSSESKMGRTKYGILTFIECKLRRWYFQNCFSHSSEFCNILSVFFFLQGINSIRRCAKTNEDLISPRIIGNTISSAKQKLTYEDDEHSEEIVQNVFAVMFGQAIAHDIGKRIVVSVKGPFPSNNIIQ